MASFVVAAGFVLLALAHSLLGERELLQPLFARSWELPIPRWAAQRIFRFAWHLTSVAWLGLAGLAVGLPPWSVLALVGLVSGLIIFVMLRGHLAWPLFAVAGAAAAIQGGVVSPVMLSAVGLIAAGVLFAIGALHVYWAAGGRIDYAAVAPTAAAGQPLFRPPAWATAGVAVALLLTATVFVLRVASVSLPGVELFIGAATVVFGLRAVGEGRYVGFSKSHRDSRFARLDDRIYTPLSVLFAFGGTALLLL